MALLEQALRTEAAGTAGSAAFREQMLTSEARRAERAHKAPSAVPTSGGPKGLSVLKCSLTGRRRAPGALAPQEDDPGGCQAQLDPLDAVPALLPARIAPDLWVEPDAGICWLEYALVGRVVLRIVQRRAASATVDGVARAERLHRRRTRPEGAGDPLVAAVLLNPTADVVYELPERNPLIYSHARHRPLFLAPAPGEHLRGLLAAASWGGRGCWGNASRMSFIGPPLPRAVRERSSPRLTTVRSGAIRPSVRPVLRYPKRAEGGTHRPYADCKDRSEATQGEGHAPKLVEEGEFSEVRNG
jgi:hypothetical protein